METTSDRGLNALIDTGAKRIGILGGTFNPIHNAHLEMCELAMEQFDLDCIALLVAGNPPHKASGVAPKEHRLAMAELAVKDRPEFCVLSLEVEREGKTFTIDTLRQLKSALPDAKLFYIIGSDTLLSLHTWHKASEVFELTEFICFYRCGDRPWQIHSRVKSTFAKNRHSIHFGEGCVPDISSTNVRVSLAQGAVGDSLIDTAVLGYIREHNLYADEALSFSDAKKKLYQVLKAKRFEHTMGVVKTAEKLAKRYDVDRTKVKWAALLHDCARDFDKAQSLWLCEKYGIIPDEYEGMSHALLHATLGARIASEEYLVSDEQVLSAIACHTVGKQGMSDIDKVVYLADAIEPNRDYPNVKQLRKVAAENLDDAVRLTMEMSIDFVIQKNEIIHPLTVLARNELLPKARIKLEKA